jgi:TPR repeat protein
MMVDDGRGTRKDRRRSLDLFEKACDLGEAESCFTLGRAYQTGNGRERDDRRAAALLERTLELAPDTPSAESARKALAIARAAADQTEEDR